MSASSEYLAVLKASYDYAPQSTDEVEIKEDQLVFLLERTDDEWWKVKVKQDGVDDKGPVGLVPASYLEDAAAISHVKALYDYDAAAPGELTIKEDDELDVFDREDEWILVKKKAEERVGYVPANYCDEDGAAADEEGEEPEAPAQSSNYVDPAERVAAASTSIKSDPVQTWAVSEVDAKNKKKKGTLGVGSGSIFFASESDKTPVQRWDTKDVLSVKTEKSKHLHIEIGGAKAASLHFHAGPKEVDAIVAKLNESRSLASTISPPTSPAPDRARSPPAASSPSPPLAVSIPQEKPKASVHFSNSPASIIPPADEIEGSDAGDDEPEEGEPATTLYDFAADGEDELSVREGDPLRVLDRTNDEWWKCRNVFGAEGVVPASYVELAAGAGAAPVNGHRDDDDDDAAAATTSHDAELEREAREREEREEQERVEQEEREEQRRKELERKKKEETERKAKATAAAAAAERQRKADEERTERARQEKEKAKRDAEAKREAEVKRDADSRREREAEARRSEDKERRSRDEERPSTNGASSSSKRSSRAQEKERPKPDQSKVRTWHDRTGQFQVDAEFLGFNNGLLRLHKTNGVVIEVPSEKMSAEDMQYIDSQQRKPKERWSSDDDKPLGTLSRKPSKPEPKKKSPSFDWFEFFLNAGCDIDDCTRYALSFERDKIDEAILPDIKESTLRSLGLREGDIIRVTKAIETRKATATQRPEVKEQVRRDEELARHLQAQEDAGIRTSPAPTAKRSNTTSPAPNLFSSPDGVLKPRRGRPERKQTAPPTSVTRDSIASVPERAESPALHPSRVSSSPSPVVPPKIIGGFEDDAWTVRPSKSPAPQAAAPAPAPVASPPAPAPPPPPPPPPPVVQPATQPVPAPPRPVSTNPTPTTQDQATFELLSKIAAYRPPSAPAPASQPLATSPPPAAAVSPPPAIVTPPGFQSGLGMGSSTLSIGQHLQAQQTGIVPSLNVPRGPLAPVPSNQSLLQPLVPTTTGFNGFIPTRPASSPLSFQPTGSPFQSSPFQNPSVFQPSPLMSQPTGYPVASSPLQFQTTGFPQGGFASSSGFGGSPFAGGVQMNPTGFNPSFNQYQPAPPPVPPLPQSSASTTNAAPANIFAQMKAGTFASDDDGGPQSSDKYDALRQPNSLTAQPTGWGQMGSYQTYGFQPR